MEKIFINLTNHKLNKDQLEHLKDFKVVEKEDIISPDILPLLTQSPDDVKELIKLAKRVKNEINDFIEGNEENEVWIHLPIGSPLFQALLFQELLKIPKDNFLLVYSHSKRIIEENPETGEKKSIFKFEKFLKIKINPIYL